MNPQTFFRKATVTSAEATAQLYKRFPNADLVSFEKKKANAEEALAAQVSVGDLIFAATIKVSEFPPKDDGSESEEPSDDAPAETSEDTESEDSGESEDSAPAFGGGDEGGDAPEVKKLSPEEETVHLLQQILDALKGGGAPDDLGLGTPGDDLGLPDIGAPGQGEGLPASGGPPKPPLPPPVKQKSPVGVGAFAHYDAQKNEFAVARADASEIGNKNMIAEAAEVYPTHTVAKIQRTGSAVINGQQIVLADRNIAVVTLVAKN